MLRLNKKKKIIIGISAFILAGMVVVGYIVAYKYKAIIHKALPAAVADATDSLYRISVKNVSINILNRSVTLKGVHLWADSTEIARRNKDSTAKAVYVDVVVPRLTVSSIMWDKLTGGEGYSCGTFAIIRPVITVYKTDTALTLYDTAAPALIEREFTAGIVYMNAADIRYAVTRHKDTNTLLLNHCNIEMNDWELGEESIKDTSRFLLSESFDADIKSLKYNAPNSDYNFSMAQICFSTEDNKLTARNLQLKLRTPQKEFLSKLDRQKEIFGLDFPTVELTGINSNKLLGKGELHIAAIHLNHSKINILMDRRLPPNIKSKMGNYPNQLLQKLRLPLYIKQVKIHDGSLTYSEIVEKTDKRGNIHFDNIHGSLTNITNIAEWVQKDKHCMVTLQGKFSKYTDAKATFRFVLDDPKGTFAVHASMGALQSRQINEQTKAFSNVEIKSFSMKSMNLILTGDENQAQGKFTMLYNNLGIRILKKPENIENGKRKKGLLTFIANNMVLYSSNPMPGEEIRKAETQVERDEMKSFFNLVWKSILQGVQETAIRDMEVIDWIRNNEKEAADKNTQIREFFTKDREERKERRKERRKKREQNP